MGNPGRGSKDRCHGPLPLVIGVTGHRDLREQDRPALASRVSEIFASFVERYPHTPLVLLSALAEGADRLVAWAALERGVHLIVPLPMPKALYEEDFQDAASRAEFAELLHRAERWFALPLPNGVDQEAVREHGAARDRQYVRVGAYIASHSQLLIALWDGTYTDLAGGTSQIIRFQLEGVPEPYAPARHPLDAVESGPVYHIVTPRVKDPQPADSAFALRMLFPTADGGPRENGSAEARQHAMGEVFDRIFGRLDTFNADAIRLGPRLVEKQTNSTVSLLPGGDIATLPLALQSALDDFAVADTLAMHFKARTVRTLRVLFLLVMGAVLCFSISEHSEHLHPVVWTGFWFCLLLWVCAFFFYRKQKRADVQDKYLSYRALAEGLRVHCFWRLAGLPDSVADHYLRKQKTELDWIRNSMRVLDIPRGGGDAARSATAEACAPAYQLVLNGWVNSQCDFFQCAAVRDQTKTHRKERQVRWFFGIGLVFTLSLAVLPLLEGTLFAQQDWLRVTLILIATLASVAAGLREAYVDKMAYSEQAKQYERMRDMFRRASTFLMASLQQERYEEAKHIIRELGKEALAENGDWVLLHRAKPVDVPRGG